MNKPKFLTSISSTEFWKWVSVTITALFLCTSGYTQVTHKIIFNGDGKMTQGPEQIILEGDKLQFILYTDGEAVQNVFKPIADKVMKAMIRLQNPDYREVLKNEYNMDKSKLDVIYKEYENWLYNLPVNFYHSSEDSSVKNNYINELERDEIVKLSINGIITPMAFKPNQNRFECDPIQLNSSILKSEKLNYTIKIDNPIISMLREGDFQSKAPTYGSPAVGNLDKISTISNLYEKTYQDVRSVDILLKIYQLDQGISSTLQSIMKSTTDQINDLIWNIKTFDYSPDETEWFYKTLWINDGIPKINPFVKTYSESPPVKYSHSQIGGIKSKISDYKVKFNNESDDQLKAKYQTIIAFLATELNDSVELEKIYSNYATNKFKFDSTFFANSISGLLSSEFIYEGVLYYTKNDTVISNFLRFHDGSSGYASLNGKLKAEYTERDNVHIFIENQPYGSKTEIIVKSDPLPTDIPSINELISTLDSFENSVGAIQQTIDKGQKDLKNADTLKRQFMENMHSANVAILINQFNRAAEEFYSLKNQVDAWVREYKIPIIPNLTQRVDNKPKYSTQEISADNLGKSDVTYTYEMKPSGGTKIAKKFNVAKFRRFMPSAGGIYSFRSFDQYTLSENSFSSENLAGLKWTVGIKTYPFKTNIRNTEFLFSKLKAKNRGEDWHKRNSTYTSWGNKFKHSWFIYVGANPERVTKDFQLGLGVDIWSGVSVNGGWNIIRYEQQEIWRGGPIETLNPVAHRMYVGLTVDPELVIAIITAFIPTK